MSTNSRLNHVEGRIYEPKTVHLKVNNHYQEGRKTGRKADRLRN